MQPVRWSQNTRDCNTSQTLTTSGCHHNSSDRGPAGEASPLSVYPIKMVIVIVISGLQRRVVVLRVTLTSTFLIAVVKRLCSGPSLGIYLRTR